DGQRAIGEAFAAADDVGCNAEGLGSEHRSGFPEAGDDFVVDEGDAMAVANAADDAEVLRRRGDDASGIADGFEQDAGDGVGVLVDDYVLDGAGGETVAFVPVREIRAVVVGWKYLEEARHVGLELGLARTGAAGRHGGAGAAVVAVIAADELVLAGVTRLL